MFVLPTFNLGVVGTALGPSFDDSLSFPTIQVFDTEAEFINSTDATQYTIVHAKDTDKLYVWDGSGWVVFNNDTFRVQDLETESIIFASSPTNPSGYSTVKFGTDTYDMYVWDGSAWYIYNNDYTP